MTKASTRWPPAHAVCFPPRSGQLLALAPETLRPEGPPLSDVNTSKVLSHCCVALSAEVTLPTVESTKLAIAFFKVSCSMTLFRRYRIKIIEL